LNWNPAPSSLPTTEARVTQVRSIKWSILKTDRSIPHLRRKGYHLVMGVLCVALYGFVLSRECSLALLVSVGSVWIACDILRLYWPRLNNIAMRIFGSLMRREELNGLSANSYYIIGMGLTLFVFPKPICLLSVLYLAVGDPVAAVAGTLYGRHPLVAGKSVEGSLANLIASFFVTLVMAFAFFQLPPERALLLAATGGAISAISELCPVPLNDNLVIPLVSACLLTLVNGIVPLF